MLTLAKIINSVGGMMSSTNVPTLAELLLTSEPQRKDNSLRANVDKGTAYKSNSAHPEKASGGLAS